jgi:hypothetical protein
VVLVQPRPLPFFLPFAIGWGLNSLADYFNLLAPPFVQSNSKIRFVLSRTRRVRFRSSDHNCTRFALSSQITMQRGEPGQPFALLAHLHAARRGHFSQQAAELCSIIRKSVQGHHQFVQIKKNIRIKRLFQSKPSDAYRRKLSIPLRR